MENFRCLPGVTTLPDLFKENGYTTVSNGKIYHHANDDKDSWTEVWNPQSSNASGWRDYQTPENVELEAAEETDGPPYERAEVEDDALFGHDPLPSRKTSSNVVAFGPSDRMPAPESARASRTSRNASSVLVDTRRRGPVASTVAPAATRCRATASVSPITSTATVLASIR